MEIQGPRRIPGIFEELAKKYDREKLADAAALVIKLFENIENNPVEVKYRKVKTTNPTLQSKVFCFTGINEIFTTLGFEFDGEFLTYTNQHVAAITNGLIMLRAQEVQLRSNPTAVQNKQNVDAFMSAREEEKRKLIAAMKNDRQEKKQDLKDHPAQDSKAKKINFGANIMLAAEVCAKPGG